MLRCLDIIKLLLALSITFFLTHLFYHFGLLRSAWFQHYGEKVIEHDVIDERQTNDDPDDAKFCTNAILKQRCDHCKVGVNMKHDDAVEAYYERWSKQAHEKATCPSDQVLDLVQH